MRLWGSGFTCSEFMSQTSHYTAFVQSIANAVDGISVSKIASLGEWRVLVDEGKDDPSIGNGWSDTNVTLYEGPNGEYGYVHGNCASCDESAGYYGFMGPEGMEKTFTLAEAHTHVRVSMRIWKLDSFDSETISVKADGVEIWQSDVLNWYSCPANLTDGSTWRQWSTADASARDPALRYSCWNPGNDD